MPGDAKVSKAKIVVQEDCELGTVSYKAHDVIPVMFNPSSYEISHSNDFEDTYTLNTRSANWKFKGHKTRKLKFDLFFDSEITEKGNIQSSDISPEVLKIISLANVSKKGKLHRPPIIFFSWGTFGFMGIVTSAILGYKYFDSKGNPIRAIVNLEITNYTASTELDPETSSDDDKNIDKADNKKEEQSDDDVPDLSSLFE